MIVTISDYQLKQSIARWKQLQTIEITQRKIKRNIYRMD